MSCMPATLAASACSLPVVALTHHAPVLSTFLKNYLNFAFRPAIMELEVIVLVWRSPGMPTVERREVRPYGSQSHQADWSLPV